MKKKIPEIVYLILFFILLTYAYHRFICCKNVVIPEYTSGDIQTIVFESHSDYQSHIMNYTDYSETIDSLCSMLSGEYHFHEHKNSLFMSSGGPEKLTLIGRDGAVLLETEIIFCEQNNNTVCIQIVSGNGIYQSDPVYLEENIRNELELFFK